MRTSLASLLFSAFPQRTKHLAKSGLLVGLVCLGLWPAAASAQETRWERLNKAAVEAYQQADYAVAEKLLLAALKEAEEFGEQDPRLATSLNNLAELYRAQGNYAEAEQLLRATQLDPQYALAQFRLANVLEKLGRPDEARLYYQTSLRVESPLFRKGARAKVAEEGIEAPPSLTEVPSLVGMKRAEAERTIEEAGFRLGTVAKRVSRKNQRDKVIEQTPKAPAQAPSGSAIDLVIGARGVKVPNVVGDSKGKAIRKIQEERLTEQVTEQRSCEPAGKVLEQEPRKGTRVPEGSTVTIFVATPGEDTVTVPWVTGFSQQEAQRMIGEQGLGVGKTEQRETDQETPGIVLRQKPVPTTPLAEGCVVDLVVAVPVPPVTVPRFIGMTEEQARRQLPGGWLGAIFSGELRRGSITRRESTATPGTVIDQSPPPGSQVRRGTAVNLVIAQPATVVVPEPTVAMVLVPDVRRESKSEAERVIRAAGLQPQIMQDGDVVVMQDPPPGSRVRQGTRVSLWLLWVIP